MQPKGVFNRMYKRREQREIKPEAEDFVFLLDYETLWQAYPMANDRQCKPTEFAARNGVFSEAESGNCWWWMRQVIYNRGNADIVGAKGEYTWGAADVTNNGVRPAIWVSWE